MNSRQDNILAALWQGSDQGRVFFTRALALVFPAAARHCSKTQLPISSTFVSTVKCELECFEELVNPLPLVYYCLSKTRVA